MSRHNGSSCVRLSHTEAWDPNPTLLPSTTEHPGNFKSRTRSKRVPSEFQANHSQVQAPPSHETGKISDHQQENSNLPYDNPVFHHEQGIPFSQAPNSTQYIRGEVPTPPVQQRARSPSGVADHCWVLPPPLEDSQHNTWHHRQQRLDALRHQFQARLLHAPPCSGMPKSLMSFSGKGGTPCASGGTQQETSPSP